MEKTNIKVICQRCHIPMRQIDDTTYRCTKCNLEEEIKFVIPNEEKETYPFYNKEIKIDSESDSGLYCDKCHHPLLMEGNFMLSDRDKTVNEDNDTVGVDCHCPYCGSSYSIVERKERC